MARYRVHLCEVDGPIEVPNPDCPNAAEHTPSPTRYVHLSEWAEEMTKTHRQRQCGDCGRWVIWVPRRGQSEEPSS